jgi:PHD/YefM family antitoxin component YafN of YafNO toxin-antitoxin module
VKTINALYLRNHLGQVLETLERDKEPIQVSKGRIIRAVLITSEDFQRRFLDKQSESKRRELMERIRSLRKSSAVHTSSVEVLRQLRGYQG